MRKTTATAPKTTITTPRLRAVPPPSTPDVTRNRGAAELSPDDVDSYVEELILRFATSDHAEDADLALAVCFIETAMEMNVSLDKINSEGISRVSNKLLRSYKDEHEELTTTLGALWCWFAERRS